MAKKQNVCVRIDADGATFANYLNVVTKVDNKFKIGREEVLRVTGLMMDKLRETEHEGWSQNSSLALTRAVMILKKELGEYIDFFEWSDKTQKWEKKNRERAT